jgi:hypothetical protein
MRAPSWALLTATMLMACATGERVTVDAEGRSLRVDSDSLRARYGPVRVSSANIPFDKPYDQLTLEQQRSFKGLYERMTDTDEPPFPLEGLQAVYGPIAQAQLFAGVRGVLNLEVVVDSKGTPQEVRVLRTPNARIAQAIAAIVMQVQFKPAVCAGRPCRMGFPIGVQFELR